MKRQWSVGRDTWAHYAFGPRGTGTGTGTGTGAAGDVAAAAVDVGTGIVGQPLRTAGAGTTGAGVDTGDTTLSGVSVAAGRLELK